MQQIVFALLLSILIVPLLRLGLAVDIWLPRGDGVYYRVQQACRKRSNQYNRIVLGIKGSWRR